MKPRQLLFALLPVSLLITGCTDPTVHTKPRLTLHGQPQTVLQYPIGFAIVDHEAAQRGSEYAAELTTTICKASPRSLKAFPAAKLPIEGTVSLRINIRRLGGYFSRQENTVIRASDTRHTNAGDIAGWASIIKTAKGNQPVTAGRTPRVIIGAPIYAGWSGIAHLNVEIMDRRAGSNATMTIPLAAERAAGNMLGYMSARIQADEAWQAVAPQLARLLEGSIQKVSAEEQRDTGSSGPAYSCIGPN